MSSINRRVLYPFFICLLIAHFPSSVAAGQDKTAVPVVKSRNEPVKNNFKFEVVSVRPVAANTFTNNISGLTPDGFTAKIPVWYFIMLAYAPEEFPAVLLPDAATRISNKPDWSDDAYVINARVAESDREAWTHQSSRHELLTSALQDVLKERFKLVIHQQSIKVHGLRLVRIGQGLKLKETPPGFVLPPGGPLPSGGIIVREAALRTHYYGATMEDLAAYLSLYTARPVQDSTGLTGHYEFIMERVSSPSNDYNGKLDNWPIRQLGLALKSGDVAGRTLIIDHIEKPGVN